MKNPKKPFGFRGKLFLLLVLAAYLILFFLDRQAALAALQKSLQVFLRVLPIFVLVILFTACLHAALHPGWLIKHLGRESGARGWLLVLLAGVISHGPMYAWYPMITDLRRHGLKDGLIVTFYYARAIKVPLLPFMIDCFGLLFTLVLSCYILLAALLQGLLLERIDHQ